MFALVSRNFAPTNLVPRALHLDREAIQGANAVSCSSMLYSSLAGDDVALD
jgi:hypothetical protein